ncbi:unnamed protein product [Symbiodinium sp. CCMP2456]|nr:unnamed protein product [Symbiodinium sp. CCMP2456]
MRKLHQQEDCKEQSILQLGVAVNVVQDLGCSLPSIADLSVPVVVGPNSKSNVSSLAMRGALVGLAGAVKDMPRGPAGSGYNDEPATNSKLQPQQLPTLLHSPRKASPSKPKKQPAFQGVAEVSWERFLPDYNSKLGTGAYGGVYSVQGNPDQVVKLFDRGDWKDVMKESVFAQDMKARDPSHYVDCLGVGNTPEDDGNKLFAVFERAAGITLHSAAHRFHSGDGVSHVRQALDILEQLTSIMISMTKPDPEGQLHFHLDLKPENIMIAKASAKEHAQEFQVTLIDYGVVRTSKVGDADVHDSALQVFRWLGWIFLWMLASETFTVDESPDKNPWEQLPEGFKPFFKRSDFRPPAYRSEKLSPQILQDALEEGFYTQVMSSAFRKQWKSPDKAKKKIGQILGDLFHGVALASDCSADFMPDFQKFRNDFVELRQLAKSE